MPRRPALSLRPGERRADLDFALARTYAIEGRVTNEFGEPLADVAVITEGAGGPAFFMGRPMTTDDRGGSSGCGDFDPARGGSARSRRTARRLRAATCTSGT